MGKRNTPEKFYDSKGYINEKALHSLCASWHEAGRAEFERLYQNLQYDTYQSHTLVCGEGWCYYLERLGGVPPLPPFTALRWSHPRG